MGVKSVSAFSFSLLTSIISVALHLFISAAFIHWRSDLCYHFIVLGSAMLNPARKYLALRALGSPAVLLSLAMQGSFEALKTQKKPLYTPLVLDFSDPLGRLMKKIDLCPR
ncbi:hypothetical protein H0E87_001500, partial [Populus deltoides]